MLRNTSGMLQEGCKDTLYRDLSQSQDVNLLAFRKNDFRPNGQFLSIGDQPA
jgi:hypothetical protein